MFSTLSQTAGRRQQSRRVCARFTGLRLNVQIPPHISVRSLRTVLSLNCVRAALTRGSTDTAETPLCVCVCVCVCVRVDALMLARPVSIPVHYISAEHTLKDSFWHSLRSDFSLWTVNGLTRWDAFLLTQRL